MSRSQFWVSWVMASGVGFGTGVAAVYSLARSGQANDSAAAAMFQSGIVFGIVGGVVAVLQWYVLAQLSPAAKWWLAATPAGIALGIVIAALAFSFSVGPLGGETNAGGVLAALAAGALLGIVQWPVLAKIFHR